LSFISVALIYSSMKIVGATGLVGLWALEWAWQTFFWINR